jgi:hypothetical protein
MPLAPWNFIADATEEERCLLGPCNDPVAVMRAAGVLISDKPLHIPTWAMVVWDAMPAPTDGRDMVVRVLARVVRDEELRRAIETVVALTRRNRAMQDAVRALLE